MTQVSLQSSAASRSLLRDCGWGVGWRGKGGQEQSVSSGTCSLAASLLSWLVLAQICIPHNALSIVIEASVFPEDLLPLERFSS